MPFSKASASPRQSSLLSLPRGGASNDNRMSALHAAMVDAISAVNEFYMSSPYLAAALTCGTKASAADYVAQRRHYKKRGETTENLNEKYHVARNVAFLIYGAFYQGVAQEYIYNQLYPVWFGTGSNPIVVLSKVLFNLLVQTTLVTLPIAHLTKAAVFRYSTKEGMRRYKEDIVQNGLLKKYFLLTCSVLDILGRAGALARELHCGVFLLLAHHIIQHLGKATSQGK